MTKDEKEVGQMFWYKEPRLMHLNPEYSREKVIKQLKIEIEDPERIIIYDEIIKFNNWANEFNLMVDLYHQLQIKYMGGKNSDLVNQESWIELFKKFDKDNDNLLSKVEFREMIKQCGQIGTRATDADTGFLFRVIASTGQGGT